jgi:hypothetical protein
MTNTLLILLLVFQLKHWLADYPLQTPWMLGKFKDRDWVKPLAAHAGVHAAFTFSIVLATSWILGYASVSLVLILAGFDFAMHFSMDRVKASPKLMGRWKSLSYVEYGVALKHGNEHLLRSNTYFWWALGFDQGFHHVTHYLIITAMLWR